MGTPVNVGVSPLRRLTDHLATRLFKGFATLGLFVAASACGAGPIEIGPEEALEHQTFEHLQVRGVPAVRISLSTDLTLTIDEEGKIAAACKPTYDDKRCDPIDPNLLANVRYRPFFRNGQAVKAIVNVDAQLLPAELIPTKHVSFPRLDLSTARIILTRSSCYGSCPAYTLEIDGKGNIRWRGDLYTVLSGEYQFKIPIDDVRQLIEKFEKANFFGLANEYAASVTDNPTYNLMFSMSGRSKLVSDYVGEAMGMPAVVTQLENEVDRVAGSDRWVLGTPETVAILKAKGFDFRSKQARDMLMGAIDRPSFMRALLVEMPQLSSGSAPSNADRPLQQALISSVRMGNRESTTILIAAGAAKTLTSSEAGELLEAAAVNVDPTLIKQVLAWSKPADASPEAKLAALKVALEYGFGMVPLASRKHFDKEASVAALLAAGADPNRLDKNGETILEWVHSPALVRQLVAAGADLNLRNKSGRIPLLSNHNEETTIYLLQITKPGIADPMVARDLKARAAQFKWPQLAAEIDKVNVRK